MQNSQRLYWSLSKPLRWIGLSLDEWGTLLIGLVPGTILLNTKHLLLGTLFLVLGIIACYLLKKFKKLSEYFLLKSYLLSKRLLPPPSKQYPDLLGQEVGK